jgi:CheY-like chemotaxis protein
MTHAQAFRFSEPAVDGVRVLLVSSDELRLRRLAGSMKAAGGAVTAVCASDEALALLRIGYRPGVLLMDGELPEPDRLSLAGAVCRASTPGAVTILTIAAAP